MSMLVAALVFVPLLAIAIALFVWSLGGTWPLRDRELLPRSVMGRPGAALPPRPLLFVIALIALAIGVVALALADHTGGGPGLSLLGLLLAIVFVGRGVAGYTGRWREAHGEEPFATLDRRNYSPAALVIGAGFLVLVLMRLL